ncbi:hypothetical protein D3C72_2084100 [compost metagenome]
MLEIPVGAELLSAGQQRDLPVVYAIGEMDNPHIGNNLYAILLIGTGEEIYQNDFNEFTFLDTVMTHNDSIVYHIYYKKLA